MESSFDDPKFRAQMRRAGVVHRPGLADEMMQTLAPLLADEGYDVDNLGDADIDAFNDALQRATDRHNVELFTPVGGQRQGALAVLRSFTEEWAGGHVDAAQQTLAEVPPEAGADEPAVSHLIGAALGAVDTWFADPELRAGLAGLRVHGWDRRATSAATDITSLAQKGRAFDSLNGLHCSHAGKAIMAGAALVVAEAVRAVATRDGVSVEETATRLLSPAATPVRRTGSVAPAGGGEAFGLGAPSVPTPRPMTPSARDRPVVRELARWLRRGTDNSPGEIDAIKARVKQFLTAAREGGIDLHQPDGAAELAELLGEVIADAEPGGYDDLLALDAYVHFRMDTSSESVAWAQTHTVIEDVLDEVSEAQNPLAEALEADRELDPEVRAHGIGQTPVVAAVRELLDWLGSGRACSPSGGVRRSDIQYVAGLLGVSAVGVTKRPSLPPVVDWDESVTMPETLYALSMQDVPPLAAWWEALQLTNLLEVGSTRIWPGPAAEQWSGPDRDVELAEMLVAGYVAEILSQRRRTSALPETVEEIEISAAIRELVLALAPATEEVGAFPEIPDALIFAARLRLNYLEVVSLVEWDEGGALIVAPELRGTLARALLLTAAQGDLLNHLE